jgi:putative endonuclease
MFVVYVLYSPLYNKTYTGFTSNLSQRLISHNYMATKGFTTKYRPWVLLFSEAHTLKASAMKREKELKAGRGRSFIKDLVKKYNESVGFISA